jgi:ankyrin repeat protein
MPIQRWFTGIAIVALLASTPVFAAEPLGRAFPAIGDYPNARDVRDRLGNYLYVRVDPGTKKPVELIMANFPPAEVNVDLEGGGIAVAFQLNGKGRIRFGGNNGLILLLKKPGGGLRQQMAGLPSLDQDPIDEFLNARKANPRLLLGAYLQNVLLPKLARGKGGGANATTRPAGRSNATTRPAGRAKADPKSVKLEGNGREQITRAIFYDRPELIAKLLKDGAEIDAKDTRGATLLNHAVDRKHVAAVKLLLEHKADPNSKDKHSRTPMTRAIRNGSPQIVELLVKHGADVNAKDRSGRTLLMQAVDRRLVAVVKILLENKADPNIKDKRSSTPIFSAVRSGSGEIIELLTKHGADINTVSLFNYRPLMHGVRYEHEAAVKALIKAGAKVNVKTRYGSTVLQEAVRRGAPAPIVKALVNAGADVAAKDRNGRTAFDFVEYRNESQSERARIISVLNAKPTPDAKKPAQDKKKAD